MALTVSPSLAAATSSPSRVRVHDASGGVYEAKLGAIVTVPLGVLKAGGIEFVPPLPHDKQAAIDKLAMGVLDKVFLVFERAFWDLKKAIFFNVQPDGSLAPVNPDGFIELDPKALQSA